MHRDHDILEYHSDDADHVLRYEDPHFHAPTHERYDHDPLLNERRPDTDDFHHYSDPLLHGKEHEEHHEKGH